MTAAQIQAAAQAQAQAQASASTTGTGSQLTAAQMQAAAQAVASSTATSTYAQQMAAQANAIVARAPTSWPQDGGFKADPGSSARSAWFGFYAPAAGHPVQSDCGPNQFMSMLANPVSCIDNFATNSPIVLNPAVPFDPSGNVVSNTITDPYCAGLTAREGIGSSRQHLIDSTKTRTSQGSEGVVDSVWQQKINCFVGEAYKNQPYANPWVTANNLFGINQIYLHPSKGTTVIWTNFCKDAITLSEAKKRNDQQLAAGVHNDLYTNNSRLYVPPVYAPSLESVENSLTYLDHPGTNMNYWWNGNKASQAWSTSYETFYTQGDIKDPEFLALFNAFQFEQTTASNVPILMRCMDPGYISNLPPVAGHYQSEIIHDKKLGLIQ